MASVLRTETVEGVILATPHLLHEEQIVAVVSAGKEVFCEKPLTMTVDGAARILEACDKGGKILGVGHERQFQHWADAIEKRVPYRFTAEQLIENIRLFTAIVSSSRQGGALVSL